jgi:hypothetical protein
MDGTGALVVGMLVTVSVGVSLLIVIGVKVIVFIAGV